MLFQVCSTMQWFQNSDRILFWNIVFDDPIMWIFSPKEILFQSEILMLIPMLNPNWTKLDSRKGNIKSFPVSYISRLRTRERRTRFGLENAWYKPHRGVISWAWQDSGALIPPFSWHWRSLERNPEKKRRSTESEK